MNASLEPAQEDEGQNDNNHKSKAAGWIVTPPATIRPGWEGANKKQDQNDQNDGAEGHVHLRWNICIDPGQRLATSIPLLD